MRTILISGGNRGIGKSIAERALKDGNRISLGIRNLDSLSGTILDPNVSGRDKVLLNYYEANDVESAKDWIKNTIKEFGEFDTLINCAGIFKRTGFLLSDEEIKDVEEIWKVNVMGPWLLTREAWNHLIASSSGRLIFLGSMSGKRSKGKLAGYSMSKFALMGLCQTIRNEGWEKGLRVTAICPSWVNTDMASKVNTIDKADMTQPEDIASIISNLLLLPKSSVPFEIAINCNLES